MATHITGIDHTVILVRDLDMAAATYAALGFTLSPRGFHSEHMGTANHTIMLEDDYFEVLSPIKPTPQNARWRTIIEAGDRLGVVALRTDDAGAAAAELRAAGIAATDPIRFERPVELPGGGEAMAAFEAAHLPAEATPGMAMFACKHHTPEVVWLAELQRHANGARRILEVTAVAEDPGALAPAYARIFGPGSTRLDGDSMVLETGSAAIRFLAAGSVAAAYPGIALGELAPPRILGLALETGDLQAARQCLAAAGAAAVERPRALIVPPARAHGVLLEFRAL